jgi:hypothetical protein
MAVLEIETFSLKPGIDATSFRALDELMQEWCYLNRPGLARRTTARDHNSYVVVTLFGDQSQSDANYYKSADHVASEWSAAIDESSRSVTVYSLL